MIETRIDVGRLIRIATLLVTIAAAAFVYVVFEPRVDALVARIDDGRAELRSDDIALREVTRLRAERSALARRYASLFAQNSEAVFVRELATTVRRHGVTLVSTSATQDARTADRDPSSVAFDHARLTLELRGAYRPLLETIADLSTGSAIAEVREPNLRRDGDAIAASVPVVVYEVRRADAAMADGATR